MAIEDDDGHQSIGEAGTALGKLFLAVRLALEARHQWNFQQAVRGGIHELKHAWTDPGRVEMGLELHPLSAELFSLFTRSIGDRTPEQRIKIALAAGNEMSPADKQMLETARLEIKLSQKQP